MSEKRTNLTELAGFFPDTRRKTRVSSMWQDYPVTCRTCGEVRQVTFQAGKTDVPKTMGRCLPCQKSGRH